MSENIDTVYWVKSKKTKSICIAQSEPYDDEDGVDIWWNFMGSDDTWSDTDFKERYEILEEITPPKDNV